MQLLSKASLFKWPYAQFMDLQTGSEVLNSVVQVRIYLRIVVSGRRRQMIFTPYLFFKYSRIKRKWIRMLQNE